MPSNAARAIEREIQFLRKMLALEINKARWLDEGDVDQSMAAQEASNRVLERVTPLFRLLDALPQGERPVWVTIEADPELGPLVAEHRRIVSQINALCAANQDRVRSLMDTVAGDLRTLHRNRTAMRGYHGRPEGGSQILDGKM